jgi:hypothetical protein
LKTTLWEKSNAKSAFFLRSVKIWRVDKTEKREKTAQVIFFQLATAAVALGGRIKADKV